MGSFDATFRKKSTIRERLEKDGLLHEYLSLTDTNLDWSHYRYPDIEPSVLVELKQPPAKRAKISTTTQ